MKPQQSGFTLVEIAIVLVIIGLLLGGVLKGQELIDSAKVKNLANDFRIVPVLIYGYQDKYRRLPGDDDGVTGTASGRFGSNGTPASGPSGNKLGNGIIEGAWSSKDVRDESVLFWQHARLAGLAAGSTDFSDAARASLPTNAAGGQVGIQMSSPIKDLNGTYYLCSSGINSKLAQQLDLSLDDGAADKGSIRAQEGSATNATAGGASSYSDGKSYVVCQAF